MIKYHKELEQGSEEWLQQRCGMITASEVKLILTPTLKVANNDNTRSHLWELAAQRITGNVEQSYVSDDMLRGHEDEILAREQYHKNYAPVTAYGFVTNDKWGFTLGYSPDGLVGLPGTIEIKSRRQKHQLKTICEYAKTGNHPKDFDLQIQTGLLVAERDWCDLVSYCGGMFMVTMRVESNPRIQAAIIEAATVCEDRIAELIADYKTAVSSGKLRIVTTLRSVEQEIIV